ncbi:hypothetical protein CEUSTIGMA_g11966.t1 [Chlamydomonas eustigma]|uniref:AP2/ERF domain-containing protein n=1 Tax=Chlamydomonas eustigma TaxID=1157962 RepID=A0A250XN81_9CHLO|nr:hypothetical protein CEUSTIGMA_g11966.t1 [Chlamydomonas eustigma]|eukprot:GAX84545.1 hypothetical protein CEUSTIGMA_g11966.t1 [Chlamydomonas eustigma]
MASFWKLPTCDNRIHHKTLVEGRKQLKRNSTEDESEDSCLISKNKHGYRGVRKRPWGSFAAEIRYSSCNKRRWIGTFPTAAAAAASYDAAAIQLHGIKAVTNFSYTQQEISELLCQSFPFISEPSPKGDFPPVLIQEYDGGSGESKQESVEVEAEVLEEIHVGCEQACQTLKMQLAKVVGMKEPGNCLLSGGVSEGISEMGCAMFSMHGQGLPELNVPKCTYVASHSSRMIAEGSTVGCMTSRRVVIAGREDHAAGVSDECANLFFANSSTYFSGSAILGDQDISDAGASAVGMIDCNIQEDVDCRFDALLAVVYLVTLRDCGIEKF